MADSWRNYPPDLWSESELHLIFIPVACVRLPLDAALRPRMVLPFVLSCALPVAPLPDQSCFRVRTLAQITGLKNTRSFEPSNHPNLLDHANRLRTLTSTLRPYDHQHPAVRSIFEMGLDCTGNRCRGSKTHRSAQSESSGSQANLAISCLRAAMGPGRDFRGTVAEQKTAMTYCKALIDQAAIIGCPSVVGPLYSVVGKADAVPPLQRRKEWTTVVKNLKRLARHAEASGG